MECKKCVCDQIAFYAFHSFLVEVQMNAGYIHSSKPNTLNSNLNTKIGGPLVTHNNMYTAISRKVVGKNVHATTPKGNMGYDQYTVPNDCSCRTYFCCFPLALANICPWPLVPFFQISLENRADKTTHNTFRDCRVHFFRQPF